MLKLKIAKYTGQAIFIIKLVFSSIVVYENIVNYFI